MSTPVLTLTRKDFQIEFLKGSGKGGQNRNKRETAVRIRHIASGQEVYCCEERSQLQNLRKAFERIAERMKPWLKLQSLRKLHQEREIEEKVDRAMMRENLRIEAQTEDGWREIE